jgi:hypothetical protein
MSHGLGNMQRAIIAGLKPAMAAWRDGILHYPGSGWGGKVRQNGRYRALADDQYDLRAVLRFLAHGKSGAVYNPVEGYIEAAFQKSFSRAAHGLEARGVLVALRFGTALRIVELTPEAPSFDHPWVAEARRVLEARDKARRQSGAQMKAALMVSR